ncbi:leucyl aminopeptidase [Cytophagaceae bacterium ABcell3]|nr:leucyl aminopeptidase [Cytophagaceae bacterium ABcell3]
MHIKLKKVENLQEKVHLSVLLSDDSELTKFLKVNEHQKLAAQDLAHNPIAHIFENGVHFFFIKNNKKGTKDQQLEALRSKGAKLYKLVEEKKLSALQLFSENKEALLSLAEGLMLSSYRFDKYKSNPKTNPLDTLSIVSEKVSEKEVSELNVLVKGVCLARDLVNEPLNALNAVQLAEAIQEMGNEADFKVDIFHKPKIQSLKMGGLLAVNEGSPNPPTFTVMEYKPENAVNDQPYILVGKGVVYDTGGLSLKPSSGMEFMKSDMGGAASVAGAIYAIAANKLPIYIIGMIPATENRPDGNAMVPGDVITTYNGKTVEVLNTDAEGRLILADALAYASKYKPELVIDLATLTGAAARTIGKEGVVCMGNTPENIHQLQQVGLETHERLVEFPLWEEYGKMIESDIADLKNIGGAEAGAITAGKFLEHFVEYDWIHIDIAGMAFLSAADAYRSKNGTGIGVRLMYNFFKKKAS